MRQSGFGATVFLLDSGAGEATVCGAATSKVEIGGYLKVSRIASLSCHLRYCAVVSATLLATLIGCGAPSNWIEPPAYDAEQSAAKAMELYDQNSDNSLDSEELQSVPGLQAALKTVDADGNGEVSEEEIANRIRSWQSHNAGLTSILCEVSMGGQPLQGATVTFEPESFLGDDIKTAVGETTRYGQVSPSIPKENRPTPETPSGLQLGFYRVRITRERNGEETIPSKYNKETVFGQQVAPDDPAVISRSIHFQIKP